jgi:transcriptional regulator with XRE-family HTH domain
MTPEEFKQGLARLGWKQTDFARATGTSTVTVSHWMTGQNPLPVWAQSYLTLLLRLQALAGDLLTPPTRAAKLVKALSTQTEEAELDDGADLNPRGGETGII